MLTMLWFLLCMLFTDGGLAIKEDANMLVTSGSRLACNETERQALLIFKASLIDYFGYLADWGSKEECCKWAGVQCNNHTGHVTGLYLSSNTFDLIGNANRSLQLLNQLRYLILNGINFRSNPIPNFLGSISSLEYLDISNANLNGPIPRQLANLSHLRHLNLSGNNLWGSIPFSFGYLPSLTHLDLSNNQLGGVIPKSFGNFSSLVHMNLSVNHLNGSIPHFVVCSSLKDLILHDNALYGEVPHFTGCSSLSMLSLSYNSLNGSIPDFTGCTSLQNLVISSNFLNGSISNSVGQLPNLEYLDVSNNSLNGNVPNFEGCPSLWYLDLSINRLTGNVPNRVGQLLNLEHVFFRHNYLNGSIPSFTGCPSLLSLDLSGNQLTGNVPISMCHLLNLEHLDVSSNSLKGVIINVHFLNLTKLTYLDLSFNSLALNLSSHGRIPFQLETIKLQSCKLGPWFPTWIKNQTTYMHLDISDAGISDSIPSWFWELPHELNFLNLSSNELKGMLPNKYLLFFGYPTMDLSYNHLNGSVSLLPHRLAALNLSGNRLSGTLSYLCLIDGQLTFLDLSNNLFSGSLPDCWLNFQNNLIILNLSNNNLSGEIPSSLGFLSRLEALYLRSNAFVGEFLTSLCNCTSLRFLDLGENKLSGNIPRCLGESVSKLYILVLRSNRFYGRLPSQLCWLSNLQVLDMSNNGLSGNVSRCFGNFTSMATRLGDDLTSHYYSSYVEYFYKLHDNLDEDSPRAIDSADIDIHAIFTDNALVRWKGKEREFGRSGLHLLKSMDLSSNNFSGKLPNEITSLVELVSLNFSTNKLHGEVPEDMGRLKYLESLDLSRNEFSGHIPWSLSHLNFLNYLDLSDNSLSGRIPTGTQLQGFNSSFYSGNPQLCGPPLTPRCGLPPVVVKKVDGKDGDKFRESYYMGLGSGFAVGFWGICGVMFLNRRFRHFLFALLSHVKDWIYVTVVVHFSRLQRRCTRF